MELRTTIADIPLAWHVDRIVWWLDGRATRALPRRGTAIGLTLLALLTASAPARSATDQTFDVAGAGSTYVLQRWCPGSGSTVLDGGPSGEGQYLQLVGAIPCTQNAISFDLTDSGAFAQIVLDLDFRITPSRGRGDGFGVAFLNTDHYGVTGSAFPGAPFRAEEPNFSGSVGIGFDINKDADVGDIGNVNSHPVQSNSVSVHYDNSVIGQFDVSAATDLASGRWIHARIILRAEDAVPTVSVILTPCDQPMTVVDRFPIPALRPYQARIWLGGRSGELAADQDIDNVRALFSSASQSVMSFAQLVVRALDGEPSVSLTVNRLGNLGNPATVDFFTTAIGPTPSQEFVATSGNVSFGPGDSVRTITVQLPTARVPGNDRAIRVSLTNPAADAEVGGPSSTIVVVEDHERARQQGRWSNPICLPIVPVHAVVMPNSKILYWDRLGNSQLWDIRTGASSPASQPDPDYDMFCSGQSLRPDGTVLITGGHDEAEGVSLHHDGVGVKSVSIYDYRTDTWSAAPDMNAGRWYPTNVPLSNGDTLVVSGSMSESYAQNTLPQVLVDSLLAWRDLTAAEQQQKLAPPPGPLGVELYPRMFSVGAQRVVKVGPDQQTWYLETGGAGAWIEGPLAAFDRPRIYGTATLIAPGQVLVTGGAGGDIRVPDELPTATTEVIDLTQSAPRWQSLPSMAFRRRQHNATLLPDGNVFIAGGSSAAGFGAGAWISRKDGVDILKFDASPVFDGEMWNPATQTWTVMAKMQIPRLYHSVCMLLPDARVLCGGGGQGSGAASFQSNAEIYSPPYLFRSTRPVIAQMPDEITYGQRFLIATGDAQTIDRISLIRLASVTHSFDQNQAFALLDFDRQSDGLLTTAPTKPWFMPPGHYLLFIVTSDGVPSIGRVVHLGSALVSAVLPSSRSVLVGTAATAFATIVNASSVTARACSIAPRTGFPATFTYQLTEPTSNAPVGTPDTPIDIAAGELQTFVFAVTSSAAVDPTDVALIVQCTNSPPAPITFGVNTMLLSASAIPIPDIVALSATVGNTGVVNVSPSGSGAFSVATANVGVAGSITVSADTNGLPLPLTIRLCQTNPAIGECLAPPTSTVTLPVSAGATPTFGIFVTGTGAPIRFAPASNRIFVRFKDADGIMRGSTSVAVRTQ